MSFSSGDHDASLLEPLTAADFESEEPLVHAVSTANVHLAALLCRILRTHYEPESEERGRSSSDSIALDSAGQAKRMENRLRLEIELANFPSHLQDEVHLPSQLFDNAPLSHIWAGRFVRCLDIKH